MSFACGFTSLVELSNKRLCELIQGKVQVQHQLTYPIGSQVLDSKVNKSVLEAHACCDTLPEDPPELVANLIR